MIQEVDKKAVGQRIKRIRLEMGYTQEEFGACINKAHKTLVSKWEKGSSLPHAKRLSEIAFQGQMSVEQLLHGKYCEWREVYNSSENVVEEYTGCEVVKQPSIGHLKTYDYSHCPFCGKELLITKADYLKRYTVEMIVEGEWYCIDIDEYDEADAMFEAWDHFVTDDDFIENIYADEPKRVLSGCCK